LADRAFRDSGGVAARTSTSAERPGCPRLVDDITERRILMDAVVEVMQHSVRWKR